jgi:hypothetical protein
MRTAVAKVVNLTDDPTALVVDGAPAPASDDGDEKAGVATRRFDDDGKRHTLRFTIHGKKIPRP